MKVTILIAIIVVVSMIFLFANNTNNNQTKEIDMANNKIKEEVINTTYKDIQTIYFAGGCFWGVEGYFKRVDGVVETQAGYANGLTENPTYSEVINGSGHAETVKVDYNENVVSLEELILHFLRTIDPYSVDRQGNDVGGQYRSGIYYTTQEQAERVKRVIQTFEEKEGRKTAIEIASLQAFYDAEDYHQDYLDKNPYGYCHIDLNTADDPLIEIDLNLNFSKDDSLKDRIGELSFNVTRNNATERPYTSEYDDFYQKGIYVDIVSGEPLFVSDDKFHSGCGWPSFSRPIESDALVYVKDTTHGMERIEVRSKIGDSHLGHVFNDGPKDQGGLRYCIMEQLYGLALLKRWTKKGTENIRFWSNNIPNPSLASMGWVLRFN
jgi:peptide methionine sulfoxide reductase msrA/msrB